MRLASFFFIAALTVAAQEAIPQLPRVDVLDFYGRHNVSANLITQALGVREGSLLPPSKGDAEERINQIPAIVASRLEAAVRSDGKTVLYVGVEERNTPHYELRPAPGGAEVLPAAVINTYKEILSASRGTDTTALAAVQDRLPALAAEHFYALRAVLRDSSDELHRAAAAYILLYSPRKAEIVDDYEFALHDSDPAVRANAVRALTTLAKLEEADPASRVRVSMVSFVDMLDSLAWTDRLEAARALVALTQQPNALVMTRLRTRALDAVVEMARWKTPEHAQPAFILAGRMAGWTEQQIGVAWTRGDPEAVVAAVKKAR